MKLRRLVRVALCALIVASMGGAAALATSLPPPEKPAFARAALMPKPPEPPLSKLCPVDDTPWEQGEASHYADMLAGYSTAFGGQYDPDRLTAAHLSLPEGARILVRDLDSRKSVILTVTDRGPFAGGGGDLPRILDVSGRAARILGFYGGVAPVEIHRCAG